jgi:hypothetical protein
MISLATYDPFADTGEEHEIEVQGYLRELSSFIGSVYYLL